MFLFYGMNRILILAAVLPAILLLFQVYRVDRLEREPIGLLVSLVILGAVSTLIAIVVETIGDGIVGLLFPRGGLIYNIITYFIIVAFGEEGAKYLMLKKRTWRHPAFNCQFDGVVYAVCTSLGFALWENIGYVTQYGLGTALVRAVTAVPGHACFGVFMGIFYGIAKRYERGGDLGRSRTALRLAILMPALLHGCYDFIASSQYAIGTWIFLAFIIILFIVAIRLVRQTAANDRYF